MEYKNIYEDFFYEDAYSTSLSYRIEDADGNVVFTGRAHGTDGIRINVAQKIRDWLDNEIGDFREADGVFFEHPEALKVFSLISDGTVLGQWTVLFSWEPWDGSLEYQSVSINGHASPAQKLFFANGTTDDGVFISIDDGGPGDGPGSQGGDTPVPPPPPVSGGTYFTVSGPLYISNESGNRNLYYETDYATQYITVDMPEGVTLIGHTGTYYTFSYPANTGKAHKGYVFTFKYGGVTIGTCTVNQENGGTVDDYVNDYLTLDILDDSPVKFHPDFREHNGHYSVNGGEWTLTPTSTATTVEFHAGDQVRFYAESAYTLLILPDYSPKTNVYGNITSLIYGTSFNGRRDLGNEPRCCGGFFGHWKYLVDARRLVMPTSFGSDGQCIQMFNHCTSLLYPPDLPAMSLREFTYYQIFWACESLVRGPQLPATTLGEHCYEGMFYECHNLLYGPTEIPATTIPLKACQDMYYGCHSLLNAPALPATVVYGGGYAYMFYDCRSLVNPPSVFSAVTFYGTYNCAGMFCWCTSLTSGVPLNATVVTEECYMDMFNSCPSIDFKPVLPATYVPDMAYRYMFRGCSKIKEVTILATSTSQVSTASYNPFYRWLNDTAPNGTLKMSRNLQTGWSLYRPATWTTEYVD